MNTYVFGAGPLPISGDRAVTAPGARSWQIARCVIESCIRLGHAPPKLIMLDAEDSEEQLITVRRGRTELTFYHRSLGYDSFIRAAMELHDNALAIVATGSAAPYYAGALAARGAGAPLWVDVFGDPLCENQSQAQVHRGDSRTNEERHVHIWRLLSEALTVGDRFSTLSSRQRHALYGQLGCAGRLNQYTAAEDMVSAIPFGYYIDELPARREKFAETFTLLWCGSFNTWMDVDTLAAGLKLALEAANEIRLLIAGGGVTGYNLRSFDQFKAAMQPWAEEGRITYYDWLPAEELSAIYQQADAGLSIDRFTYEAVLGSRTRIAGFLAHGLPVVSTDLCEFTDHVAREGLLYSFDVGNPQSLCEAILWARNEAVESSTKTSTEFIRRHYDSTILTNPLANWLKNPTHAGDHRANTTDRTNELAEFWERQLTAMRG